MVHCFCCKDRNIYLEEHYYLVARDKHKQINPTEFEIAILIAHMARMGKYIYFKKRGTEHSYKRAINKMRTGVCLSGFPPFWLF